MDVPVTDKPLETFESLFGIKTAVNISFEW